jgi:hypothetical protein
MDILARLLKSAYIYIKRLRQSTDHKLKFSTNRSEFTEISAVDAMGFLALLSLNSDNVSYLGKISGVEGGTTRGTTALVY